MATNGGDSSPPTTALERLGRTALLGLFVLALAGGAALLMRQAAPSGVEVILPTPTPPPSLEVYLTGAVARPDTYAFRDGERLADVLKMAGGANADADLAQVNLALRLRDQEHFHVPRKGETVRPPDAPEHSTMGWWTSTGPIPRNCNASPALGRRGARASSNTGSSTARSSPWRSCWPSPA